ncbi:PKD domain-containing protein [Orenia marismortui]|uniref:PKD domain-containing protein n=1 Tax=Orenia marismortui TaxID=46469 RepID=UPI00037806AE|nr:PKD domain-containing protein [Orenia marismortui]
MNRSNQKLLIILLVLIFILGCRDPLVVGDFIVDSEFYHQRGYLIGNSRVKFKIKLAQNFSQNIRYQWTTNGGQFLSQDGNEAVYYSPQTPGDYNINVVISDKLGNQSTYNFPFSVKGAYPERVVLKEITTKSVESGIKIEWSKYLENDFYAYKIFRSKNTYIDDKPQVIAEIDSQGQHSYIDYEVDPSQVYTYQIMVINRYGYFSLSNEKVLKTWQAGVKEIETRNLLSDILTDPIRPKVYVSDMSNNKLLVLDSNKEKIIKEIKLSISPKKMFLSKDNNFLFLISSKSKNLLQVNLNNYTKKSHFFNNQIKDITISDNYIYLNTEGAYNLIKFNILTGKVEGKFKLRRREELVNGEDIKAIGDEYLVVDEIFGDVLLYELNDFDQPIKNLAIDSIQSIVGLKVNDNYYLYNINEYLDYVKEFVLKANLDLKLKNTFVTQAYPKDFYIDEIEKLLFIISDNKTISIFSTEDYNLKNNIKFKNYLHHIAVDNKKKKIYLITSSIKSTENNIVVVNY